jgi:hypothetical protein
VAKKVGSLRAFQDRFFTDSVKDDIESGIFPPEDIEKDRMTALEAEQEGRGLFLAAVTLEAVLKHSRTRADMISLMEHYVLEHGRDSAAQMRSRDQISDPRQQEKHDTESYANSVAAAALNGILAQIKK